MRSKLFNTFKTYLACMNIDISPELEKNFKRFVLEKHGKLRGKLGEEMEKAISSFLIQERNRNDEALRFVY